MSREFCYNEDCLLNHVNADDEQMDIDIIMPNGSSFKYERFVLQFPNFGTGSFCSACKKSIFMMVENPFAVESLSYKSPKYCSNDYCWLSTVEVPDDQIGLTVTDPDSGESYSTTRNWFKFKSGHNKPLCMTCTSAIAIVHDDAGWPEPSTRLILPDRKIVVPTFQ